MYPPLQQELYNILHLKIEDHTRLNIESSYKPSEVEKMNLCFPLPVAKKTKSRKELEERMRLEGMTKGCIWTAKPPPLQENILSVPVAQVQNGVMEKVQAALLLKR
ncbi:hypothetical protein CHS0354_019457 [Potamilus streckersoni]|uniref:Uncharacterized protein n=1 Tax=Potamilus streckersoni TaxID=2493646 RepID=A0AAE0SI77_9BIVA|nr:hypothetical protein CHS0354_019457 [Potamilus streckersoni]